MLEAVSILEEWKDPSSVETIYGALEASQTGRYSALMNRNLMTAAMKIDPVGSPERFRDLGFSESEIEAVKQLTALKPVAQSFVPRQKSIALTKATLPEPSN